MAGDIVDSISERMGTQNRGVFVRPGLYVLRKTTLPAVLVEIGFISNADDARKMENDPYGFAYGIYNGILEYFDLD